MMSWTNRRFVLVLFVASLPLLAQRAPAGSPGGAPVTSPTVTGGNNNPLNPTLNRNTNPNGNNNPNNDLSRPIFLSGKVMFDDGSPVNKDIRIERSCGSVTRTDAHADSSGRFSFQVGNNAMADISAADASDSNIGIGSRNANPMNQNSPYGTTNGNTGGGGSRTFNPESALWGCELRAAYPGYRSDIVTLAGRRSMDDPNVGTIILHHLSNVQGTTISITTAGAPKSAQKNYDKGMLAAQKGNVEEAEKRFTAATTEYPKYAVAWFALGQVEQRQDKIDEARKSYLKALDADKKYVSPFDQLAWLAARENQWSDAADYSKQAIDLNPVEFPSSFWYNTVSNYNLNHDAEATKSGQALLKLDTQRRFPEVNRLLAELSIRAKDYTAAATYLKTYLAEVPNAKDADTLKANLLKMEEAKSQ